VAWGKGGNGGKAIREAKANRNSNSSDERERQSGNSQSRPAMVMVRRAFLGLSAGASAIDPATHMPTTAAGFVQSPAALCQIGSFKFQHGCPRPRSSQLKASVWNNP